MLRLTLIRRFAPPSPASGRRAYVSRRDRQPAVANKRLAAHEIVLDQEGDRLGDVVRSSDASRRRARGERGEGGRFLIGAQEIPPGRVDHAGRYAIDAQRLQLSGEDRRQGRDGRVRRADARRARHGAMGAHRGDEGEAAVLAQSRQGGLSASELWEDLLFESLSYVVEADARKRPDSASAAKGQNEMIDCARLGEEGGDT